MGPCLARLRAVSCSMSGQVKQRFRTIVIALLLGLAPALSSTRAAGAQQSPSALPNAVIPAPTHDFGEVKQGERLTHTFVIRNDGGAPLEIQRIDFSVPGVRIAFPHT